MSKNNQKIQVTKTFLPPRSVFDSYIDKIWESGQLTNQGGLLTELENQLSRYLDAQYIRVVANGTLALQIAFKSLNINKGEIITTPFSYVATTSAILWERCSPVFVDVEPDTFCIDADKIENAITPETKAILAVHVFGNPCNIEKIEEVATRHNLKVIYDAAHAFGVTYKGKSLLSYGDISICSFHATKLFHMVEGGCIIAKDKNIIEKVELIKRFGHNYDDHYMLGLNAKASEFHAAMGLSNLPYLSKNIERRKEISELYDKLLSGKYSNLKLRENTNYNYSYYPLVFDNEKQRIEVIEKLNKNNIFPRRYFYPSLNTLTYLDAKVPCPISEDVARRIICLPLYAPMEDSLVNKICEVLTSA